MSRLSAEALRAGRAKVAARYGRHVASVWESLERMDLPRCERGHAKAIDPHRGPRCLWCEGGLP